MPSFFFLFFFCRCSKTWWLPSMWMTVGRSPWRSGWRGGWTTCLCWSCSGWRWQHVWLVLAAERLRWMFAFSFCCFSFQSSPHISRFRSGTASISGGWSTLTSPPTAACVRTCCWASANRDSAAPVRAPGRQQGAAVYSTQMPLWNELSPKINFSSSGCKYTVHNQCANKNPEPCARTFVKSKKEIGVSASTQHLNFYYLFLFTLIWVHFLEPYQWSNTVGLTTTVVDFLCGSCWFS